MKKIELVIFDVDGLLLDTEAVWQKAYKEVGAMYGIDNLHTDVFKAIVGRNGKEAQDTFDAMVDHPQKELIRKACTERGMARLQEHIDVKPGAKALLDYLKSQGITCVVATSTSRALTKERLARVGLSSYFTDYTCGDEVTWRKPDPEIYEKACHKAHGNKETTLVLEDSIAGVEAAYRAGLAVIMVPDLIMPTVVQEKQTIAIMKSLGEVQTYLETHPSLSLK